VLSGSDIQPARVAVVIPSYRCKRQLPRVLSALGSEVHLVYVVDDACPEATGDWVAAEVNDARVRILRHAVNQGVGAAVITGYTAALRDGADIIVKVDGDAQMDPAWIPRFLAPIVQGRADYTKGNRFFTLASLRSMPRVRLIGNVALSFLSKLSTGYWRLFDVTNGYTAIHARLLPYLELQKISKRYFFETDLLFRLGTLRAAVVDVPLDAVYNDEQSSLRIWQVLPEFAWRNLCNFAKRIVYTYFLRDFNVASVELLLGTTLMGFGVSFGGWTWLQALDRGLPSPLGTIMLAVLPTLVGIQLLLAFISYDVANQPQRALHPFLPPAGRHHPLWLPTANPQDLP
jgi:glycosyltransferase involved in cell wall biosynthesis